jgi:dihydrofolate reductase
MSVFAEVSMSIDGFVAGPNPSLEDPLGEGGEQLHEWVVGLDSWREAHGIEGGERTAESELVEESRSATGAVVMGRKMFSGGSGPWEDDPKVNGWWGDEPPFGVPVYVLTHHEREPLELKGTTFVFVTEGAEAALAQAREAAGDRSVLVAGGASVVQQLLGAGLVDELQLHIAPVLLGRGVRLFDGSGADRSLELLRVSGSPLATHVRYRVT